MTWNSGAGSGTDGTAWVSDGDGYARIEDADVRADEAERLRAERVERDAELFTRVAEVDPGIVRTMSILIDELARVELPPEVMRGLAARLHKIADTVAKRADRIVIDGQL